MATGVKESSGGVVGIGGKGTGDKVDGLVDGGMRAAKGDAACAILVEFDFGSIIGLKEFLDLRVVELRGVGRGRREGHGGRKRLGGMGGRKDHGRGEGEGGMVAGRHHCDEWGERREVVTGRGGWQKELTPEDVVGLGERTEEE